MTKGLRAVFDTNVFVSAYLSRNPTSPTQELINRWLASEFTLLVCDAIVDEFIEKLTVRGIAREDIEAFVSLLDSMAEWVPVPQQAIVRTVPADTDDDVIVACAVVGGADFLVTYDPHFEPLGDSHKGIKIVKALPFLWAVRGDQPPGAPTAV
ncbi:MAG: putative toxin-antitoxin system toxin component, PIN family [Anaerolineae bacterium]|uniref:putative toxin-antitoxin system toxin component, PIN family n=1 Tax=Candidatus Amarolinea dominans TaxID=3140696 RepID=UPI0031372F3D|nr:putative toxin-antitoxin system toxin component, PIN family [Anaerolineae bacterium]